MGLFEIELDDGRKFEIEADKKPTNQEALSFINQQQPQVQPTQQGFGVLGKRFKPQEVEQKIAGREDVLGTSFKQAGKELKQPTIAGGGISLPTGLGLVGGAFQRVEAAVANPLLSLQRGEIPQFEDITSGLRGRQLGEIGDVFRAAGVPENISKTLGLAATIAIGNLAALGKGAKIAQKGVDAVKPGVLKAAKSFADDIATKLPGKPRLFQKTKILNEFVEKGQAMTDDLQRGLNGAFDDVVKPIKDVGVDFSKVDEALLRTFVTDADKVLLKEVDDILLNTFGNSRVDSIEKLRFLKDILRKRTPASLYKGGGTIGKGGLANVKVKQKGLISQIDDIQFDSLNKSGFKEEAKELAKLNKFASEKVYPQLDNLRVILGKSGRPTIPAQTRLEKTISLTGGFRSLISGQGGGPIARAGERAALKETTQIARGLQEFINSGQYGDDLLDLIKNSRDFTKLINQFRRRQGQKLATLGAGAFFGGRRLIRGVDQSIEDIIGAGGGDSGGGGGFSQ